MLSKVLKVWTISLLYTKELAINGFIIFTVIVQPVIIAILAIYLLQDTDSFQANYVIVGSALSGLWSGTIFIGSRGFVSERRSGTLEEIVGSPTHISAVIIAKALTSGVMSIGSAVVSYPLAVFLFGYEVKIIDPLIFVLSIPLALVAITSLGLVIAPIMALRRGAWIWSNAIEFPVFIASGFLFPVTLLPAWSRVFSYLLTPYWAARILHFAASKQVPYSELILCWSALIGLSGIYLFLSTKFFEVVLLRSRIEGTLGQH